MVPEWAEVTLVMPTNIDDDQTVAGCAGRVFISGVEIKNVSSLEIGPLIGDDIPSITLTIEPRNVRVLLDSDFTVDDEGVLVYDGPRKLRIRKQE